ncbi:MAG UNVERIFIED_CONTAM: hypothetical protein LVR18_11480 [Planctomycetaceae bacterium]
MKLGTCSLRQRRFETQIEYVFDKDSRFAGHLGATSTTDIFVLDGACTVLYHGAIDDQYGFGYSIDAPRHTYLRDALNAALGAVRFWYPPPPHPAAGLNPNSPRPRWLRSPGTIRSRGSCSGIVSNATVKAVWARSNWIHTRMQWRTLR